jgi:hypothetical protein
MRRLSLALALTVLLLLTAGVATATASPPVGQSSGQLTGSDQAAGAVGGTAQQGAANSSQPIRVLSEGDDGDVSQTNEASSNATAANANSTTQTVDQESLGANGTQVAGQSATNAQDALALGLTLQKGASNENAPVDVKSPSGEESDGGSVSQENTASSDATAGNVNATEQAVGQEQAGSSCSTCGSAGTQIAGQSASNDQEAAALSATEQENPSNTNVSIRVLSPGDDGDVSQTNEASSNATAANANETQQTADQDAGGHGGTQVIGQSADSDQDALAAAKTEQESPKNENISIRVLSPGKGGSVTQSNVASSNATAANVNSTEQTADQEQTGDACKCKGAGTQIVGQSASNDQEAAALSATKQEKPSNTNVSIRVLSEGDDGDVEQSNVASSDAVAANANGTTQSAEQGQGGAGTQIVGQSASSSQDALALGFTAQKGASNVNAGIRVLSPGHGGSVTQSNSASSNALAGNANHTEQAAGQSQAGDSCKCGAGVQIIGQSAKSEQHAAALSATLQLEPSNTNAPIRVLSKGDDGDVTQSNDASSKAIAANENGTKQSAEQSQAAGAGLQVIGQESRNDQFAAAAALTAQIGPRNENAPVRVLSPGKGGSVSQSNTASSNALAGNVNGTDQAAGQEQGSDLKGHCCGTGIQVIGQSASNRQGAKALALTLQAGAKPPCKCGNEGGFGNRNAPTRVLSPGADGDVSQSNKATSDAKAANRNWTNQDASQIQDRPHPCRCKAPGFQVIGQYAASAQLAAAVALTLQLDAHNRFSPERKESPGKNESLHQSDRDAEGDKSGSSTATNQSRSQVER